MRRVFPLLAALLLGAACAVLVACGGSGDKSSLIPAEDAATMAQQLDTIQTAVRRGRCSGVDTNIAALQRQINDLSGDVDAGLRSRLQEGVNNLANIGPDECFARRDEQQRQTQTVPAQTVPTQTTETQTTPETTPETTLTTPQTTPTTPQTTPTVPQTTPTTAPVEPGGGTPVEPGGGVGDGAGGAEPTP